MRESTLKVRERGVQMRHFRAIAQDLAALSRKETVKLMQRSKGNRATFTFLLLLGPPQLAYGGHGNILLFLVLVVGR